MFYNEKKFNINNLKGISDATNEEHLKLYAGYVKHCNLILEKLSKIDDNDLYIKNELRRRLSFEFDGMKNHELFFEQFDANEIFSNNLDINSDLYRLINESFINYETWLKDFKSTAMSRGIGFAILYFDKKQNKLINSWVSEQHVGHLTDVYPILLLDMWEHAYMLDKKPSQKTEYIDAFFENLNFKVIENRINNILN